MILSTEDHLTVDNGPTEYLTLFCQLLLKKGLEFDLGRNLTIPFNSKKFNPANPVDVKSLDTSLFETENYAREECAG